MFHIQLALAFFKEGHDFNSLMKLTLLPLIENEINDMLWKLRANEL